MTASVKTSNKFTAFSAFQRKSKDANPGSWCPFFGLPGDPNLASSYLGTLITHVLVNYAERPNLLCRGATHIVQMRVPRGFPANQLGRHAKVRILHFGGVGSPRSRATGIHVFWFSVERALIAIYLKLGFLVLSLGTESIRYTSATLSHLCCGYLFYETWQKMAGLRWLGKKTLTIKNLKELLI